MYILHMCKNHFPSSGRPGQLLVNSELQGTKFQLEIMKSWHWDQSQNPFAMWKSNGGGATKHFFFPKCFVEVMSFDLSGSPDVDGGETLTKVVLSNVQLSTFSWYGGLLPFVGIMNAWMWLGPYQFETVLGSSFKVMNNLMFWFYKIN